MATDQHTDVHKPKTGAVPLKSSTETQGWSYAIIQNNDLPRGIEVEKKSRDKIKGAWAVDVGMASSVNRSRKRRNDFICKCA